MKQGLFIGWTARALAAMGCLVGLAAAAADDEVDVGQQVPRAESIKQGLFPDDECRQLMAAGFKCMGFQPAKRYSLPATAFSVGSADLPDLLRRQLDVFAEVLRGRKGPGQTVRIEGHADASGSDDYNRTLSQRRADAVKQYLVRKGADGAILDAVGLGAEHPKVAADPFSAENRRVEIGRAAQP